MLPKPELIEWRESTAREAKIDPSIESNAVPMTLTIMHYCLSLDGLEGAQLQD